MKRVHLWMDKPAADTMQAVFDAGFFGPDQASVTDPSTGERFPRPQTLERGYSQVPINLKQNMPLHHPYPPPKGSEHYKLYIRFRGDWSKRMPMNGCYANRWNFYDLKIKRGDECSLWELPWNDLYPDVPVVESNQAWHPVFLLKLAPGDYQRWLETLAADLETLSKDGPSPRKREITLEVSNP